jgi:hypothetical protein
MVASLSPTSVPRLAEMTGSLLLKHDRSFWVVPNAINAGKMVRFDLSKRVSNCI